MLTDAIYVFKDSSDPINISASKIELWSKNNFSKISNMFFEERDEKTGKVKISGKARKAELRNNFQKITLQNGVQINIFDDKGRLTSIKSDDIKFDSRAGELIGEGKFSLSFEGSVINGIGLKGNVKTGVYVFDKVEDGIL